MKVLFLTGSLNQGGAEFQILLLAKLFRDNGHEVEVFALTDYKFLLPFVSDNNIKYSCLDNGTSRFRRIMQTLAKFRSSKPELVVSYLKAVSQVAIFAKLASGARFKLIVGERTSLIRPRHDLFYFNLLRFADVLTVNSVSKLDYITKRFKHLKEKAYFMPNCMEFQLTTADEESRFASACTAVSYVGRISPEKNLHVIIEALKIILDNGCQFSFQLFGEARHPKYMQTLTDLIKKLNLEKHVEFKGPTNDVRSIYLKTDLLCLMSSFEGFSNVLSEAIISGVPVVASNIPENYVLVENNVNGFLTDPKSAVAVAAALTKFFVMTTDEKLLMSQRAKAKAAKIFDRENLYHSYLDIINNADHRR